MRKRPRILAGVAAALFSLLAPSTAHASDGETKLVLEFVSPDSSEPADKQRSPMSKTLAEHRQAATPDRETPAEVKERTALAKKLSTRKGVAARAGWQPASRCLSLADVSDWNQKTIDHWTHCHLGHSALVAKDCRTSDGKCKEVGAVRFRVLLLGEGNQGESPGDRKFHFNMKLDNFEITGDRARVLASDLTLKLDCLSYSPGSSCTPDPNNLKRTLTIEQWSMVKDVEWEFQSPDNNLTDRDKIAMIEFQLQGSTSNSWDPLPTNLTKGISGRCDSASYVHVRVATRGYGCVFDNVISEFGLIGDKSYKGMFDHINLAQNKPNDTFPKSPALKVIPGSVKSGKPLERLGGDEATKSRNYRKSRRTCIKTWGAKYTTAGTGSQSGKFQCDEYPFQSTYQGAVSGGPQGSLSHFSVMPIPATENEAGGRALVDFYNGYRIIDHDKFYVTLYSGDGIDVALPVPPPSSRTSPRFGDMNGDGKSDLVTVLKNGKLRFFPGQGDGYLGSYKELGGGFAGAAIAHGGDFNGDNKEDIVARVGTELRLYPGKGDGTVGSPQVFKGFGTGWDTSITKLVTVEDATDDGYPDIITSRENKLWLYPGDPNNQPGLLQPIQIGGAGWDKYDLIPIGLADDDDAPDLAVRNRNDGWMYYYPGPLNRELSQRSAIIPENAATNRGYDADHRPLVTAGNDSNNDGRIDVWMSDRSGALWHTRDDKILPPKSDGAPFIDNNEVVDRTGWDAAQSLG